MSNELHLYGNFTILVNSTEIIYIYVVTDKVLSELTTKQL